MSSVAVAEAPHRETEVGSLGISWQKMLMWWFLVGDALLFASFLAAYMFNRMSSPNWPDRSHVFSLRFIATMTFTLITSSATMATAVAASRKNDRRSAALFVLATILGGAVFLGMQAVEWKHLIGEGARLDHNPWGAPGFSAFFFTITGFHGTHVLSGVVILAIVALKLLRGRGTTEGVELAGLYWHFVDLVWVFIFGCFYLL